MKKNFMFTPFFCFIVSSLVFVSCCTARPNAEPSAQNKAPAEFMFLGRVTVMGNEPHTYTGICTEDESKIYAVYPEETAREIRKLQGRLVQFVAVPVHESAGEASLYLKDGTIRLISWKIVD